MQGPSDIKFLKKKNIIWISFYFFVLTGAVMVCHIDKRISATGQKQILKAYFYQNLQSFCRLKT